MDLEDERDILSKLKKHDNKAVIINVLEEYKNLDLTDKILVLQDGKNVGFGAHKELSENCEFYKKAL